MQWWEEDRSTDGFYTVTGLQAPSVFHRKDGMAVVLWKASWSALSSDEGKSWSKPVKVPSIITDGAKVWGQRTKDGRFAMLYNPANDGTHRWPLAIVYARPSDKGRLEVEVLDQAGHRPVRVAFATDGVYLKPEFWHRVEVVVDATAGKYDVSIDESV